MSPMSRLLIIFGIVLIAIGVLWPVIAKLALKKGFRVPEDISIVGFDDIAEAAYSSPSLTTVRLPPDIVGLW